MMSVRNRGGTSLNQTRLPVDSLPAEGLLVYHEGNVLSVSDFYMRITDRGSTGLESTSQ
jgi:hypothetical protein